MNFRIRHISVLLFACGLGALFLSCAVVSPRNVLLLVAGLFF